MTSERETTESESVEPAHLPHGSSWPTITIAHHPTPELMGVRAVVGPNGVVLGRTPSSCLPGAFEVPKISREHTRISVVDGAFRVIDQQSRNGTYLNGEPISEATATIGDIVGIGGVLLLLGEGPATFPEPRHPTLLGKSWALAETLDHLGRIGRGGHTTMLIGETGSGKELAAATMHEESGRAGPLLAVNCGAFADSLLESELFGHAPGAFTGARVARVGLLEQADGGTLFLDEITSTSPRLQAALLRFLEDKQVRPVGSNTTKQVDVRIVAAGQPDIEDRIDDGRFRSDLWFRLSRRIVSIPSLSERVEDIPLLALHFARGVRATAQLSPSLSLALCRARWPGNVRQLRNVAEQIADASGEDTLTDLRLVPGPRQRESLAVPTARKAKRSRPTRETVVELMSRHEGKVSSVAQELGVNRKSVYRWIAELDIELDQLRAK